MVLAPVACSFTPEPLPANLFSATIYRPLPAHAVSMAAAPNSLSVRLDGASEAFGFVQWRTPRRLGFPDSPQIERLVLAQGLDNQYVSVLVAPADSIGHPYSCKKIASG
jgi:hypothetical protein